MAVDQAAGGRAAWQVSQQGNGRRACCTACKEEFALGETRLQTPGGSRFYHWHCLGKRSRAAAALQGAPGVPAAEVDRVRALLGEAAAEEAGPAPFEAMGAHDLPEPAPREEDTPGVPHLINMAWWDTVDAHTALAHKVATMRRVPSGLQAAWTEAMGKALEESVHGPSPLDRERAWKLVMFAPRLVFAATGPRGGRGASGKRAKRIQHDLSERLHAFWRGEWQPLWDMAHRRELRAAPVGADDIHSKVRRIHAMLDDGQVAGAVATLRRSGRAAAGHGVRDQLETLLPGRTTWDPAQADAPAAALSGETRERVSDALLKAFRKAPGGRAPGPDGSRNEHWRVLAADPAAAAALVEAALAWVGGEAPSVVDDWLCTGSLAALHKAGGGVRPLTVLAPFRRIVLTGVVAHTNPATRAAAGAHQYGLGVPGGADVQFKVLQAAARDRPGSVLVAVDVSNAFGTLSRSAVLSALGTALPGFGSLLSRLYARPALGLWRDSTGAVHELSTGVGVPQGCPLSPAAYAVALHHYVLRHLATRANWLITAYLDDVIVVVPSAEAEEFLRELTAALNSCGLTLNAAKTKVWLPPGHVHCPETLRQYVVDDIRVVGSTLSRRQDDDWDELALGSGGGARAMNAATDALRAFGETLRAALAAGLGPQEATAMLRWTAQGLPNHLLRAQLQDLHAVQGYDRVLRELWDDIVGEAMTDREWAQACLPLREGGLAAGAAGPRREAAHVAAWYAAAARAAAALGLPNAEALLATQATGTRGFLDAVAAYNGKLPTAAHHLQASLAHGERTRQKTLMEPLTEVLGAAARAGLPPRAAGRLLSCGGPGAGAFTLLPTAPEHRMHPDTYRLALRRRLLMEGHRLLRGLQPQTHCRNTSREGAVCGAALEPDQHHAVACERGGARVARHNRVRDLLARWLAKRSSGRVLTEQTVPQWQRRRRNPTTGLEDVETAVLDIAWTARGVSRAVDVVVVSSDTADDRIERARAAKAGLAAEEAARAKERRYPPGPLTPLLTPFAVECGGRVGDAARRLILDYVDRADGDSGASADALAFWQELSATLQTAVVEQLLSAHRPPVVGGGR